jgi:hypothetical protein
MPMGGRMKIQHHAVLEPAALAPSATKPTFPREPIATTDPFASLFESLSGRGAGSSASKTVSPMSIFGPSASTAPSIEAATATTAVPTASATVQNPGIQALVSAIMNGSFQATYVTNQAQLQETTPVGTDTMPNFYYASDQTANQLASLLGGTVVQRPAFGQDQGWNEPLANFIQLPSGQTFNAADVAYYARCGAEGPGQLTADLTQTINEGAAWTNYYVNGGQLPSFSTGYVGPPIGGMTYPAGSIGADGNVINPAMQGIAA